MLIVFIFAADFADVLWAVSHVHHLFAEAEVGNLVRDMNSLFRRFTKQPVLWTATPREVCLGGRGSAGSCCMLWIHVYERGY